MNWIVDDRKNIANFPLVIKMGLFLCKTRPSFLKDEYRCNLQVKCHDAWD